MKRLVTSGFELLPAIDLRGGRVVRLKQGDFERETAYSDDSVAVAVGFADAGARWLHVVDLDGARAGEPVNGRTIGDILRAVGMRLSVEVAGGIRDLETGRSILSLGAARIVVGTAAIREPDFARRLIAQHGPERVAVALDVRDGRASGEGWNPAAATTDALDTLARLVEAGVETVEVTAIDRDGLLEGPDLDLLRAAVAGSDAGIIASAGIATVEDIADVRAIGCTGAIIGRALYEGRLSLRDALAAAAEGP